MEEYRPTSPIVSTSWVVTAVAVGVDAVRDAEIAGQAVAAADVVAHDAEAVPADGHRAAHPGDAVGVGRGDDAVADGWREGNVTGCGALLVGEVHAAGGL
jgi:hypothetical protein